MRFDFIIIIEQRNIMTRGEIESRVGGCADIAVGFTEDDFNARIEPGVTLEFPTHCRIGRQIIRDTEFPMRIELTAYRIKTSPQIGDGRIVNWHEYRDRRSIFERAYLFGNFLSTHSVQTTVGPPTCIRHAFG